MLWYVSTDFMQFTNSLSFNTSLRCIEFASLFSAVLLPNIKFRTLSDLLDDNPKKDPGGANKDFPWELEFITISGLFFFSVPFELRLGELVEVASRLGKLTCNVFLEGILQSTVLYDTQNYHTIHTPSRFREKSVCEAEVILVRSMVTLCIYYCKIVLLSYADIRTRNLSLFLFASLLENNLPP